MKKILNYKFILLFLLAGTFIVACEENEDVVTVNAAEGGLIDLRAKLTNLVVGDNGTYTIPFVVFQSEDVKTDKIEVYKTFNTFKRDADGELVLDAEENPIPLESQSVLLETLDVDQTQPTKMYDITVDFQELREGLQIEGEDLATEEAGLSIGDYWDLTFVATTTDGRVVENAATNTARVSVASRFAGAYSIQDAIYYRLGVPTYTEADWPSEYLIESVNATTYRIQEYFGAFPGNQLFFTIDPETLEITYPAAVGGVAQTGNGQPLITCQSDPANMTNVPCGPETNIAILSEDGQDVLVMSFGYLTAGSGPREFYQVLQKKVD